MFTINTNPDTTVRSPLTIASISDETQLGSYSIVYTVSLTDFPTVKVSSPPFTITIANPCDSPTAINSLPNQQLPPYLYTGNKLSFNLALFEANPV